ncbi:PREDICTED: chymotrypsin-1-like [Wasmannia auropunctata]|uniref:chymotrypsin-1-like n=1 Tax=Wasmannia auropunctata TaxID=64793 RepID=UPI0005EF33E5|nr:PREDICTED: chymotrypsin-1-like [Wasmannia auropunctata]
MMKLIILLTVTIAQQVYCGETEPFIVGGNYARPDQFPHQVSLQVNGQQFCGGSIIDATHITTAAHCVDDSQYTKNMMVVTGTNVIILNSKMDELAGYVYGPQIV